MILICPCGSNLAYLQCCGPYVTGQAKAPTPEALMRSRYSAFAKRKFSYLAKTMAGQAAKEANLEAAKRDAPLIKWLTLEVLQAKTDKDHGTVEFKAHYRFEGETSVLHELSQFERIEGEWFYMGRVAGDFHLM